MSCFNKHSTLILLKHDINHIKLVKISFLNPYIILYLYSNCKNSNCKITYCKHELKKLLEKHYTLDEIIT